MRAPQQFGQKQRTSADKQAQLTTFLYSCRPMVLKTLSVDQLMARHGTDRKFTQYSLMVASQKRAGEL